MDDWHDMWSKKIQRKYGGAMPLSSLQAGYSQCSPFDLLRDEDREMLPREVDEEWLEEVKDIGQKEAAEKRREAARKGVETRRKREAAGLTPQKKTRNLITEMEAIAEAIKENEAARWLHHQRTILASESWADKNRR